MISSAFVVQKSSSITALRMAASGFAEAVTVRAVSVTSAPISSPRITVILIDDVISWFEINPVLRITGPHCTILVGVLNFQKAEVKH